MSFKEQNLSDFSGVIPRFAMFFLIGILCLGVMFISVVEMPRSVVATGVVKTTRASRVVQHDTGGIVADLHINEGERVEEGAPLISLDQRALIAEKTALGTEIVVLSAERERIVGDAGALSFSSKLNEIAHSFGLEEALQQENQRALAKQRSDQKIKQQIADEKRTLEARRNRSRKERQAKQDELDLVRGLIAKREPLVDRGFVSEADLNALRINEASLRSQIERLAGDVEALTGAIVKAENDAVRVPDELTFQRLTRVSELSRQIADRHKRLALIEQALTKSVVRAPVSGQVIELSANTIGSFAAAANKIAIITPENEELIIDVRLEPRDIDAVREGMLAKVVFPAFSQRNIPEIASQIESITTDVLVDRATGGQYYHARLKIPETAYTLFNENDDAAIISGMPVDVYITVRRATFLEYLWAPLHRSFRQSFRA